MFITTSIEVKCFIIKSTFCIITITFLSGFLTFSQAWGLEKERVRVAILTTNDDQMVTYQQLFRQFETATGISVDLQFYNDSTYKQRFNSWIELGNYDLLYWQAGKRLKRLVEDQSILSIDSLIDRSMLNQQYRQNALEAVSYDGRVFALPLGQYIWGFYYNKQIFEKLELSPPNNWQEFTKLASALKANGVLPLVQSSFGDWPVLGWLDYFAIDIGGIAFRQELIEGRFGTKKQQKQLVDAFAYLVENDLFLAPKHTWRWEETIPTILHQQVGMTLIAQFVEGSIPKSAIDSIGFFPFPYSSNNHSNVEVAPMEVLVVPKSSNNPTNTKKLIDFIIQYTAIDSFAPKLGWASVSNLQMQNNSVSLRTESAKNRLETAQSLVQYFDREAEPQVANLWAKAIIESINSRSAAPIKQVISGSRYIEPLHVVKDIKGKSILNFSTISSTKGSFLASKIMTHVYQSLNYEIHINRFPSSDSAIKSLEFGADGDLVRVVETPLLTELATKVPESIANTDIVLIGSNPSSCKLRSELLTEQSKVSISADSIKLKQWANILGGQAIASNNATQAWQNLQEGKLDYLIAFEPEVYSRRNELKNRCLKKLETIPAYHFLANKNADLSPKVTEALSKFKKTKAYKDMLLEFGLGKLTYVND